MYLDDYGVTFNMQFTYIGSDAMVEVFHPKTYEFLPLDKSMRIINGIDEIHRWNRIQLWVIRHGKFIHYYEFRRLTKFPILLKLAIRFTLWVERTLPYED